MPMKFRAGTDAVTFFGCEARKRKKKGGRERKETGNFDTFRRKVNVSVIGTENFSISASKVMLRTATNMCCCELISQRKHFWAND